VIARAPKQAAWRWPALGWVQVCINVGILCAYAIGYPYEAGDVTVDLLGRAVPWWRIMFAAALGPCILQVRAGCS
jgi:hypothetical protein